MISVAAELAGMHPQTLRIYEQRGLIEPNRSPKGTRLYSQEDVERLRRIQELTSQLGMNLAGVERVFELEGELDQMRRRMDRLERRAEQMRKEFEAGGRPRQAQLPVRARAVRAAGAGADAAHATTPSASGCGGRRRRQMHADRFTIKSQEALAAAQKLAAAKRNTQVDPLHLLVSLLEQEGGIVVPVLRRANADPGGGAAARERAARRAPDGQRRRHAGARARPAHDRDAEPRRRGGARLRRRVRLHRAPAARARERSRRSTWARRATCWPTRSRACAARTG